MTAKAPQQSFIKQTAVYELLDMSRNGLNKLRKRDVTYHAPIKDGSARQAAVFYVRLEDRCSGMPTCCGAHHECEWVLTSHS